MKYDSVQFLAAQLTFCLFLVRPGVAPGIETFGAASGMSPYVAERLNDEQLVQRLNEHSDLTLTVKEIDADWASTIDQRGDPVVYTRENSANFEYIGMPIGGICAGQLYLGGDGKLWCWDIFNTKSMRDTHHIHGHERPYRRSAANDPAHHYPNQGFALRMTTGGKSHTRTLDRDGFKNISFAGSTRSAK